MQSQALEAVNVDAELDDTERLYGLDRGGRTADFGHKCLVARGLVERDVRFVQVYTSDECNGKGGGGARRS